MYIPELNPIQARYLQILLLYSLKTLREKSIRTIDPEISSFVNFNTPEDVEIYLSKKHIKIRAHTSGSQKT
jgi:hypothetical protein